MAVQDERKLKESAASLDSASIPHWQLHRLRKRDILAEHPQVAKLYGTDNRTQWYAYALIAIQAWLAWLASGSYMRALALSVLAGPFIGGAQPHSGSAHQQRDGNPDCRDLSSTPPPSSSAPWRRLRRRGRTNACRGGMGRQLFCTQGAMARAEYDHPSAALSIAAPCGSGCVPRRQLDRLSRHWSLYALHVAPRVPFLILSALNSQGLHPANTRQVQRHIYDGNASMRDAPPGMLRPATYSYYGPLNLLTLNVGYHVEHHDFCAIPWTRVEELRRIAGDKWYPDTNAHQGRGIRELFNFVTNKNITLADFAHEH
eukprot:IDg20553t1